MPIWTDRILPHLVDRALSTGDVMKQRQQVCSGLQGKVVEIGFGSGLNIEKYPATVESVSAVEPSDTAWQLSAHRRAQSPVDVIRSGLDGEVLDEPDDSFDTALSTFTLCTIADLTQALSEIRRVLRSNGTFVFLEHGLSPEAGVARWQRRLDPIQKFSAGGCHLTRDIPELLDKAGFEVTGLEQRYLPGPKLGRPWTYGFSGTAVPR